MNVLSPIFGEDNVRVGVTCEVEVDRTTEVRNETILPEYAQDGSTNGEGIKGSERDEAWISRPGDGTVGGVVGTEVNSDLRETVEAGMTVRDDDTGLYVSKQTDWDNTHSTINIDNNGAVKMTDCSVAVSINARAAEDFNVESIRQHTARAAGIAGEVDPVTGEEILDGKISVVAMNFFDPNQGIAPGVVPPAPAVPVWVLIAAGVGLLLFIILLTVILLLRRKNRKKREEEEARQREEAEALMRTAGLGLDGEIPGTGADVMDLEMERSMELRKDIRQFVSDNPEIAAQMIKVWLKGGDGNG